MPFPKRFLLFFLTYQCVAQSWWKISDITVEGSRKTKNHIVLRECPVRKGDSIPEKLIESIRTLTERNLMRTQLFVYDSVFIKKNDSLRLVSYHIKVKERWYIIPATYLNFLDRNINAWWLTRDWKRILIGCYLVADNTTGNKDRLYIHAAYGYNKILGIVYRFPYLNRKQTLGIRTEYTYTESGNIQYGISENKQQTYHSPYPYLMREIIAGTSFYYRPGTLSEHKFNFYFHSSGGSDTLQVLKPDYFFENRKNIQFLNAGYEFTFDNRDNKFNPTRGFSIYYKNDLFANSYISFFNVFHHLSIQHHLRFTPRWILSMLAGGRILLADKYPGYYFMKGLGYGNLTIRGYEYFIMDGGNYYFLRSTLRCVLIPVRFYRIPFRFIRQFNTIPFSLELTFFSDAGNAYNTFERIPPSIFNKTPIPFGYGTGIQICTYYDFVIRLEYSITPYVRGFYLGIGSGF